MAVDDAVILDVFARSSTLEGKRETSELSERKIGLRRVGDSREWRFGR